LLAKLSKSQIIELIGEELYAQITEFLDAINSSANEEDELEIYVKKNMIKLLLSFATSTKLMTQQFWKNLLNQLGTQERLDFFERSELNPEINGEQLVQSCLKHEFINYSLNPDSLFSAVEKRLEIETCRAPATPYKSLKTYQTKIFEEACQKLSVPRNRFIIQMPTGSGKTRTAMELVAYHLNSTKGIKDVLWLAHSVDLVDQAAESFAELWSHIGSFDTDLRMVDGTRKGLTPQPTKPSFVASTLQSMISHISPANEKANAVKTRFSLIVVDEAHMSLAPTYQKLIHGLISGGGTLVGLTATPGRNAENAEENERLAKFYFQNVISLATPENTTVFDHLRNIGIMSRTRTEALQGAEVELTQQQLVDIREHFSIPKKVLETLGNDQIRNIEIIAKLRQLVKDQPNCRIILFACSVKHSKFLVSVCNYLGIPAGHVDGTTPAVRRRSLLKNFKDGTLQILSNYGVLSTGFDAPKTDVVFIARPTASIVLYSQMIGRGLRGPNIGGTTDCLIINVRDNLRGLPDPDDIYDYFNLYFENP